MEKHSSKAMMEVVELKHSNAQQTQLYNNQTHLPSSIKKIRG